MFARFDRYLLSQLMVLFGFFSLILVLVYWLNRAVILFDQLISDGQSAAVVLEFTALTLPNVIRLVLPVSAFAATIYVTNRLSSESELVVMQATGFSAFRMARPVLVFGIIVALLVSILTHFLVPLAEKRLAEREAEISQNVISSLLNEGAFVHPSENVTFYSRLIDGDGVLHDVFMSDARSPGQRTTYVAQRALLVRSETGPRIVMFEGSTQSYDAATQRLSKTDFEESTYDIAGLLEPPSIGRPSPEIMPTSMLLWPTQEVREVVNRSAARLAQEGHHRFAQAFLCIAAALIGFSTLLLGGFSRFGIWKQIIGAIGVLILLKLVEGSVTEIVKSELSAWPLAYLPAALGILIALILLTLASRPALFSRRRALA
ncbi:MAG: LPS export ABC transporter permease LptF [Pseudomonadota bacterium]